MSIFPYRSLCPSSKGGFIVGFGGRGEGVDSGHGWGGAMEGAAVRQNNKWRYRESCIFSPACPAAFSSRWVVTVRHDGRSRLVCCPEHFPTFLNLFLFLGNCVAGRWESLLYIAALDPQPDWLKPGPNDGPSNPIVTMATIPFRHH